MILPVRTCSFDYLNGIPSLVGFVYQPQAQIVEGTNLQRKRRLGFPWLSGLFRLFIFAAQKSEGWRWKSEKRIGRGLAKGRRNPFGNLAQHPADRTFRSP
ncbi:Hypothetical protein NTJ_00009 [Nesidiocoris tenuis]|uniref:Uncharacterized protein n=1 Tax=Nesidiocoris tenuis TaxID=355587 RepID=A0ABN7A554_9HEMI|nr:Hypothetical protein NTJ_00009 [Nesidiocoris tenuis]